MLELRNNPNFIFFLFFNELSLIQFLLKSFQPNNHLWIITQLTTNNKQPFFGFRSSSLKATNLNTKKKTLCTSFFKLLNKQKIDPTNWMFYPARRHERKHTTDGSNRTATTSNVHQVTGFLSFFTRLVFCWLPALYCNGIRVILRLVV